MSISRSRFETYHVVRPAAGDEMQPVLDGDPEPLLLLEHQDQLERADRVLVHRDVPHGVDAAVTLTLLPIVVGDVGVFDPDDDGGAPDAVGLVLGEAEDVVNGVAQGGAEQALREVCRVTEVRRTPKKGINLRVRLNILSMSGKYWKCCEKLCPRGFP